jgi:TonB family protein
MNPPHYGCVVTAVLLFIPPCASAQDDQQCFRNLLRRCARRLAIQRWKVDWQEHSGFHDWGSKRVPLQLPSDFFDRPNGATTWADCAAGGIWNLRDRVQPQYPHSARVQRRQGTVLLSTIIEEDGRLSSLKTVHSAGSELDQSALSAASHWRYERSASCVESKGRTETFMDVVYSLDQ